ncbi:M20 family metallopeptidase [Vibrio sp.]|nr:M20 family metallopeptidase [Vibrio sp.]
MYIKNDTPLVQEMTSFRHDIHAHPELAYNEFRTAQKVKEKLLTLNMDEIHEEWATTGIVAVLKGKNPESRHIGLRADMDALPMHEKNQCSHRSTYDGKMHACGHDGHTTMLLTAVCWLSEHRDFEGTLYFIFQPAEENEGGARVMVEEEHFFDAFPIEEIYGMHNWPKLGLGKFAVHQGPVMAAMDTFEINITGFGGHGGIPNLTNDPIIPATQLVSAFQSIVSRNLSPVDAGVISVTQINAGDSFNIIPDKVEMKGTVRTFSDATQALIIKRMTEICAGFELSYGVNIEFIFNRCLPATVNNPNNANKCIDALNGLIGSDNIVTDLDPSMGAEDFSYFLRKKPGAYIWIGNGDESASLHNPHYDFNDSNIALGANYWIALAQGA